MNLSLTDKVALVTGGSHGLGKAICLGLAAEGAKVVVHYYRSADQGVDLAAEADAVAGEIRRRTGVETLTVPGDVAREADVLEMFRLAVERFAHLDILVNNAGIWPTNYVKDMPEAEWSRTLRVNLTGTFLTCREMVRHLLAAGRPGRIVNVSSQAAFHGSTSGHAHYDASKGGMITFTVSLAREVAPHGIAVNAVAPGMMYTEMTRDVLADEQRTQKYISRIPLRRIADPAEIADVVTLLASEKAGYMTGATVDVSGGMLMR